MVTQRLDINSSSHFMHLIVLQGHSGDNAIDILSCKTMYCYPKDLLSVSVTSGMQVK